MINLVQLGIVDDRIPRRRRRRRSRTSVHDQVGSAVFFRMASEAAPSGGARGAREPYRSARPFAGRRRIRGHEAAHAVLGAGIADDHLVAHDARRAGDGIRLGRIGGVHRPQGLAGLGVERNEPPVERAQETRAHPTRPRRESPHRNRHRNPPAPRLCGSSARVAGRCRVECVNLRPRGRHIHDTAGDDGRRFLSAVGIELERPCQS
jgi:hypothetical protein